MATVQQIIAAINPDLYYDSKGDKKNLNDFKELIKKEGVITAAEKAKPKPISFRKIDPTFRDTSAGDMLKGDLKATHNLVYDSSSEALEPVYFFLLDLMNDFGLAPEKLYDNFSSSEGSGHFGDMGQRKTMMQKTASEYLANINTVLRSILNLLYDLRDFEIRLQAYKELHSDKKDIRDGALLALKQVWMDKVDAVQKGNSSIKAMALGQGGYFSTLIDAFLAAEDASKVESLDLNQIVKRIIKQRLVEFDGWIKLSEKELDKRYKLERSYLKSQVNSLKLYANWAKPYLKAAKTLEMKDAGRNPALVKSFDTMILELTLFGKNRIDPVSLAKEGKLPKNFVKMKLKRDYYACILVDLNFRSIPQRVQGQSHYAFGGRTEFSVWAYALSGDELKQLDEILKKTELDDVLGLIEGATTDSLDFMKEELDKYLNDEDSEESKAAKKTKDQSNPFLALFGKYDSSGEKKKDVKKDAKPKDFTKAPVEKDNWYEKEYIRKMAAAAAIDSAFSIFDIYKKAHQMPSYT